MTTPKDVNYNVRFTFAKEEQRRWCEDQAIPVEVFVSYDGGGYNCHIFEFQQLDHAKAFMEQFGIAGKRSLWAEDEDEQIHYLQ